MGLFLAVLRVGHVEATEVVAAQVEAEEVAAGDGPGVAFGVLGFGIEASGVVVVTVHGVEIPAAEFGTLGVGIGNALARGLGEQVVEGSNVLEPAGTFERLEEVAGFDVGDIFIGVVLEELLAGGGATQAAQDAELAVVDVRNSRAVVLAGRAGIEGGDVGEESLGELGVEQRALGHYFFPNLTGSITSTKCFQHAILRREDRNPSNVAHCRRDVCHGALRAAIGTREGQFLLEAFHTDR